MELETSSIIRALDVSIPASACTQEALPEILGLLQAPHIHRPWQLATAAGTVLAPHVPLGELGLSDGMVLYLRPQRPVQPPVVRDAAEALVHEVSTASMMRFSADAACVAGAFGLLLVLLRMPVPLPDACWVATVCAVSAAVTWVKKTPLLAALSTILAALSVSMLVLNPLGSLSDLPGALASGLPTGITTASYGAGLVAAGLFTGTWTYAGTDLRLITAAFTTTGILVFGLIALLLYQFPDTNPAGSLTPHAAATVMAGMLVVSLAPALSTRCSGMTVPRLPSAGGSFEESDTHNTQEELQQQAGRAHGLHDGMMLGAACVLTPALLWLGGVGDIAGSVITSILSSIVGGEASGEFAGALASAFTDTKHGSITALCICACVASLMHAMRHRSPISGWALWIVALAALIASAANVSAVHWAVQAAVAMACLLAVTGPVWAGRLSNVAPTTVVWLERAEALCVAACIPLAIHIMGVVELIRGL